MARKTKIQQPVKQEPMVFCSDCIHFRRDTDGISFRRETHEFFLGICNKGLTPDSPKKQFADKPRHCNTYRTK